MFIFSKYSACTLHPNDRRLQMIVKCPTSSKVSWPLTQFKASERNADLTGCKLQLNLLSRSLMTTFIGHYSSGQCASLSRLSKMMQKRRKTASLIFGKTMHNLNSFALPVVELQMHCQHTASNWRIHCILYSLLVHATVLSDSSLRKPVTP